MLSVYKYSLGLTHIQDVYMPSGARILTLQTQNETPCIWALVDTEAVPTRRTIRIIGTGHNADGVTGEYLGTFQLDGGALVFHAFEELI